ncbi:pectin lyase fold/virulence factor [Mycena olivaceomarginata]|nr:pectin lyase fold/virulence factor [Mycena olivaceomarginata]
MSTAPDTAHQDKACNGEWQWWIHGGFGVQRRKNWDVGRKPTGWTFQRVTLNNCSIGFDVSTGGGGPQSKLACCCGGNYRRNGVKYPYLPPDLRQQWSTRCSPTFPPPLDFFGGAVLLAGGTTTITSWGQGNIYTGSNGTGTFTQGYIAAANKPSVLLDSAGNIFGRTHPQYAQYAVDQFVSVRDQGAKGDGVTDDTAALKKIFAAFAGCKIIFFDAGTYIVTSTLTIPAGTQMVGEAWSVIAGKGSTFQDMNNPKPVVQVGAPGSSGLVEITDIIFSTIGPAGGAIVVEWNVKQTTQGGAGMWDSHIRLGGVLISDSQGTWVWLADHDLISLRVPKNSCRSTLGVASYLNRLVQNGSELLLPVWLIGTASEHHVLYQYNLANAKSHYMGLIQTETLLYLSRSTRHSKILPPGSDISQAWGLWVTSSEDILVFGAALYSFYSSFYHWNHLATQHE